MEYVRLLLFPFSLLYGLAIWIRNRFFDWGWMKAAAFEKPVIVVGNLAVGGTGKSPMTEYLIQLLAAHYKVATLSRGYGRKTRGFLKVKTEDSAITCGDEPLQFKRKFPYITVAVCENRVTGVKQLINEGHEVIVLDDAYQHRALRPGLAILLFDYRSVDKPKWLLPAGNYRDHFSERRRADLMVVSKTPLLLNESDTIHLRHILATERNIPILFSSIGYQRLTPLQSQPQIPRDVLGADLSVLLLSGIANPKPLYEYLSANTKEVVLLRYSDHHPYTPADVRSLISRFGEIANPNKLIVTTEKDAQRLLIPALVNLLADLPVYVIPIQVLFNDTDEQLLRQTVLNYCRKALASG